MADCLEELVRAKLQTIFLKLKVEEVVNLHHMTMSSVEKALISFVLDELDGNQKKASEVLGISRNTLKRKKDTYQL